MVRGAIDAVDTDLPAESREKISVRLEKGVKV
jgi:hypothetical protein